MVLNQSIIMTIFYIYFSICSVLLHTFLYHTKPMHSQAFIYIPYSQRFRYGYGYSDENFWGTQL